MSDLFLLAVVAMALAHVSFRQLPIFRRRSTARHGRRMQVKPALAGTRNNKKPQWVVDEIIRLKAYLPLAGAITLAHTFNRLHGVARKTIVSKSYVAYTVRANLLAIVRLRHEAKHAKPRAMARNAVWGIDLTGKTDAAGKLHMIFGAIDHGTRRAVSLRVLANKSSWILLGHLCMAIGHCGKPRSVRTDNESVFTSRVFRAALHCLGIRHQRIDLSCPWMNGRIERFFGTLKQSLNCLAVSGSAQLQASLDVFSDWYGNVRPHANLNGATPREAWRDIDPFQSRPSHIERFDEWGGLLKGFRIRWQ